MAANSDSRDVLIDSLISTLRTLNTYTVMVSQAAADRIGINTTDLHSLNILAFSPHEMSAGELAVATGLTTASITGVIDRLEQAGLAHRSRDPHDRRRVVITVVGEAAGRRVAPVFSPLLDAWHDELETYTDRELRLITRYQQRTLEIMREQVVALRSAGSRAKRSGNGRS